MHAHEQICIFKVLFIQSMHEPCYAGFDITPQGLSMLRTARELAPALHEFPNCLRQQQGTGPPSIKP